MALLRLFPSIFTEKLRESRAFYVGVLGFEVGFESNWFVRLVSPGEGGLELGLVLRDHETIPKGFRDFPRGVLVTVVVDDVDEVHARAVQLDAIVVEPPRDMFYGMRRMLINDPNGQLIDVSSLMEGRVED
jgi:catechol 2,3-dioxygenase-like lactoylglutathione lyase family enzyme